MNDHDFITVVSGLPRSGTSMMMQIIHSGGMPALTDGLRERDEDNPKGYYEFEPVKKTREDASWVPTARGKVVKMVYRLLYDLPPDYDYRVVFMRRAMDEVLKSQEKMLRRAGKDDGSSGRDKIAELFTSELQRVDKWLQDKPNFSVIEVNYAEMIQAPVPNCTRVNEFLGSQLDLDKMAAVIDPDLYRNRS